MRLGVDFETASPEVDESAIEGETAQALVLRLAEAKARAVAGNFPNALVIGSDQVALNGDQILGKPGRHDAAVKQLQAASGKTLTFLTGLCLLNTQTGSIHSHIEPYSVSFRHLREKQIENYLRREEPYNCAGSFKSEGLGIALFERFQGDDPNSLIGLPLIQLISMLEAESFEIL